MSSSPLRQQGRDALTHHDRMNARFDTHVQHRHNIDQLLSNIRCELAYFDDTAAAFIHRKESASAPTTTANNNNTGSTLDACLKDELELLKLQIQKMEEILAAKDRRLAALHGDLDEAERRGANHFLLDGNWRKMDEGTRLEEEIRALENRVLESSEEVDKIVRLAAREAADDRGAQQRIDDLASELQALDAEIEQLQGFVDTHHQQKQQQAKDKEKEKEAAAASQGNTPRSGQVTPSSGASSGGARTPRETSGGGGGGAALPKSPRQQKRVIIEDIENVKREMGLMRQRGGGGGGASSEGGAPSSPTAAMMRRHASALKVRDVISAKGQFSETEECVMLLKALLFHFSEDMNVLSDMFVQLRKDEPPKSGTKPAKLVAWQQNKIVECFVDVAVCMQKPYDSDADVAQELLHKMKLLVLACDVFDDALIVDNKELGAVLRRAAVETEAGAMFDAAMAALGMLDRKKLRRKQSGKFTLSTGALRQASPPLASKPSSRSLKGGNK